MFLIQAVDLEYGAAFLKQQGDRRTIREEVVSANRGQIVDRRGAPLAISTPVESIWFDPKFFNPTGEKLEQLAFLLEMNPEKIKKKMQRYQKRRFVYLKKGVSPFEADSVEALGINGVFSQSDYQRFYPAGEVTANLLGYTNSDGEGLEGLEYAYDQWLTGSDGSRRVVKDLYGRTIKVLGQPKDPEVGKDLTLSIDLRIQFLAYRALKNAVIHHRAASGSIVVLDNKTGEVLAMVSQPSFNPNDRSRIDMSHVKNRAVTDVYEPGSTMKPLAMLAILESGKVNAEDVINTSPGYIRLGKKTLMDPRNYGAMTVTKIITKSSQVGMSKLALSIDADKIPLMSNRLGLGQFIGTGMPGENGGYVPHDIYWSDIERATLSYGYGLTVNTLQLAKAYSVLGAKGKLNPVSLLKQSETVNGKQVVAPEVAAEVLSMIQTVTTNEGTGRRARTSAYSVAGKTGTSHKVGASGYDAKYNSLFAGVAPANDPKITVVVSIDDPKGKQYYGGEVAAPIFGEVVAGSLRLLEVPPDLLVSRYMNNQGAM
ncbi:MAG: penicillin-binding transpeptidase domain-containing protein [Cellvibrionales bacterium]|nr:penicillin-binding transpeptidase domain-containing protein [Cellvibrionales bacterium]